MEKREGIAFASGFLIAIVIVFIAIHPLTNEEELKALFSHSLFSIKVATYSFTNMDIAYALAKAYERGVDVKIITSKENANTKPIIYLSSKGIPIRCLRRRMHAKLAIIDYIFVVIGSHNLSYRAFSENVEVSLVLPYPLLNAYFDGLWREGSMC